MTETRWRVADHDPSPWDTGPVAAYGSKDGSVTLYNDYATGRAVLWKGPATGRASELIDLWNQRGKSCHPRPVGPVEPVEGYGVFTFPYGPISMGVPESGRFDVRTYGERILQITPTAGYKARGILESLPGRSIADAVLSIERIAGNFSAAHVSAFLGACESAEGREVPALEFWIRAFAQELQRIYNHVHVIARIAEAASQNVGLAQTHALAEEVLRLQASLFGHRWMFGALVGESPLRRVGASDRAAASAALRRLAGRFEELWELFLDSRTFLDRVQATCIVDRETALRWGAVGPTLRASGISWDDRLRQPVVPYTDLYLELPKESDGDALSRVVVRAEEVRASFLLLEQLLSRWKGELSALESPLPAVAPGRGLARVEAPSGDLVYDVVVLDGKVRSVGMRSPSHANWPVFALGLKGGVFTDFHFAFESFGLSFAETDG